MGVREFPGLGFDPAPGDPAALTAAAEAAKSTAGLFERSVTTVSGLDSSTWSGAAGDGFRSQLASLPRDLGTARDAHSTAASALSDYAAELTGQQSRASSLEEQAVALRARQHSAVDAVNALARRTAPTGSAQLTDLQDQYRSARSTADQITGDLDAVLSAARGLKDAHQAAAKRAAQRIRDAAAPPYKEPSWWSRAGSAIKNWISDHADTLKSISSALKIASGVLGLLSLVPGLQFLAPVALALAGVAIGIDIALKLATGEGSWGSIALDAALTFVPGGKILGAGGKLLRGAREAIEVTEAGGRFLAAGDRILAAGDKLASLRSKVGEIRESAVALAKRVMCGDPIDVASGQMALPQTDVDLPRGTPAGVGTGPPFVVSVRASLRPVVGIHSGPTDRGGPGRDLLRRCRRHDPGLPGPARGRHAGVAGRGSAAAAAGRTGRIHGH